jgi:hypothetical protein
VPSRRARTSRADKRLISDGCDTLPRGIDRGTLGGIGPPADAGRAGGRSTVRKRIRLIVPMLVVVLSGVVEIGRRWF